MRVRAYTKKKENSLRHIHNDKVENFANLLFVNPKWVQSRKKRNDKKYVISCERMGVG